MAEFGVHGREQIGELTYVIGRCYQGPLRVGDVFQRFVTADGTELSVHLKVEGIQAYQHDFESIDEGLTARLRLAGSGTESLADGGVLSTAAD